MVPPQTRTPRQTIHRLWLIAVVAALLPATARALWPFGHGHAPTPAPIPAELASNHFTVAIDGKPTPVVHAAANYYLLSFPVKKPVTISVTAETDGFWKSGVEVQPWRLGIRPRVDGRTITFRLDHPAKISITRPNDYLGGAEMLFLFADPEEHNAPRGPALGLRYFGPGIHHENIDAHNGDRIYLAPGAVVFGNLNVWQVHDIRVFGRGTIVYDGPQNPADDDGWMHKPNWHCIVMDNAHAITIEGLTCIVRSRTWMIQMKDSSDIHYSNIKAIGGSASNANQDGMDWLGGGDTTVDDSFFRAADDIFAMQGNWEGYGAAAFAIPGHDVSNIAITRSVLSTSISNVVRAAWPEKSFNSTNFSLTDSDVIHMGLGGCKVPFALLEIWADPDGKGRHTDYHLKNIRLEDWYSLLQLRQPAPGIDHVTLEDIFALEQPSLVASALSGSVHDTTLRNITIADHTITDSHELPLDVQDGAQPAVFAPAMFTTGFTLEPGAHRPHDRVHFMANAPAGGQPMIRRYDWSFGDGTFGHGRTPQHRFADTEGTLNGRLRPLPRHPAHRRRSRSRELERTPRRHCDAVHPRDNATVSERARTHRGHHSRRPPIARSSSRKHIDGTDENCRFLLSRGAATLGELLHGVQRLRPDTDRWRLHIHPARQRRGSS